MAVTDIIQHCMARDPPSRPSAKDVFLCGPPPCLTCTVWRAISAGHYCVQIQSQAPLQPPVWLALSQAGIGGVHARSVR